MYIALLAGTLLTLGAGCRGSKSAAFKGMQNETDSLSYAIGMDLAKNFQAQEIEINIEALRQGYLEKMEGKAQLTDEQIREVMMNFQQKMMEKQQTMATEKAAKSKAEGMAFLEKNAKVKGVVTTPSGLQYKITEPGTGAQPTLDDQVKCHYAGTLLDGTQFDSSFDRGEPAVFPLRGLIKAWQEAIPLLKEGGKMELWAPSDLAYGDQGSPPTIPPGATLHFVIELIEIVGK
jgi:FKBP-type peptidyl-prolyl cis-trans isomerase